jgi:hypothetical protein
MSQNNQVWRVSSGPVWTDVILEKHNSFFFEKGKSIILFFWERKKHNSTRVTVATFYVAVQLHAAKRSGGNPLHRLSPSCLTAIPNLFYVLSDHRSSTTRTLTPSVTTTDGDVAAPWPLRCTARPTMGLSCHLPPPLPHLSLQQEGSQQHSTRPKEFLAGSLIHQKN